MNDLVKRYLDKGISRRDFTRGLTHRGSPPSPPRPWRMNVARHNRKDWPGVVEHMLKLGAPLNAQDAKAVTSYLQEKFGAK